MSHFRFLSASAIVTALTCLAPSALAWDNEGHMVVAAIAYRQLPEETRARMFATLKGNEQLYAMLTDKLPAKATEAERELYIFMRAATWPDMIRDGGAPMHKEHRSTWHYINLPLNFDGGERKGPTVEWSPGEDARNILQAIQKCETELKDPKTSKEDKAIRLCWLLHLVGDLHQPLHTVAMYSTRYGRGDEGGNRIIVQIDEGGKKIKLHSLWDDLVGNSKSPAVAAALAEKLTKDKDLTPQALAKQVKEQSINTWAEEGKQLAKEAAYLNGQFPVPNTDPTEEHPAMLPAGYLERAESIAKKQVTLAGYRLAERIKNLAKMTQSTIPKDK